MRSMTERQRELFCPLHGPAVQIPENSKQEVRVLLADMIIAILRKNKAQAATTSHGREGADE